MLGAQCCAGARYSTPLDRCDAQRGGLWGVDCYDGVLRSRGAGVAQRRTPFFAPWEASHADVRHTLHSGLSSWLLVRWENFSSFWDQTPSFHYTAGSYRRCLLSLPISVHFSNGKPQGENDCPNRTMSAFPSHETIPLPFRALPNLWAPRWQCPGSRFAEEVLPAAQWRDWAGPRRALLGERRHITSMGALGPS